VTPADEARVRILVRDALAHVPVVPAPAFARLWSAARLHGAGGPTRHPAWPGLTLAGGALAVAVIAAVAHWPNRTMAPPSDYQLAVALAQNFATPAPFDAMNVDMPRSVSRGLPTMPEYRYPLMPKELPL
jgi:hypothetical protein